VQACVRVRAGVEVCGQEWTWFEPLPRACLLCRSVPGVYSGVVYCVFLGLHLQCGCIDCVVAWLACVIVNLRLLRLDMASAAGQHRTCIGF
jgi:hypothetical protein